MGNLTNQHSEARAWLRAGRELAFPDGREGWDLERAARLGALSLLMAAVFLSPSASAQSAVLSAVPSAVQSAIPSAPHAGGFLQNRAFKAPLERGNILILLADDLGVDMLASYGVGTSTPSTPVLDNLAATGIRFRNAWSHPICSPTRASLLTGLSASRNGVGWNTSVDPVFSVTGIELDDMTLPEMLRAGTNGAYMSAAIGKWHLGHTPEVGAELAPNWHGFDHFAGTLENIGDYYNYPKVVDGVVSQSSTYALTGQVDDALAWIQSVDGPWMCYLAFNSPHGPLHAPPSELHSVDLTPTGDPKVDARAQYEAMIEALDTEIGRLLAELGSELDNTTVIFMGDNGTPGSLALPPFGADHGKFTMYEGGLNVPLIVTGPLVVRPGSECAALVHVTDVFATVADLARVRLGKVIPSGTPLDSVSMVPYLKDPYRASIRTELVSEFFFPNGPGEGDPEVLPPLGAGMCQPDLGLGGGGTTFISLCGSYLAIGNEVDLEIVGAPPLAVGAVTKSFNYLPQPFNSGFLTTIPAYEVIPFVTDALGAATIENIEMLGAEVSVYIQAAVENAALPSGFSLSNTVEAQFLNWNIKAARDFRYKLISSVNGGPTEFYDLKLDPLETNDLMLGGSLSPEQQSAHDCLVAAIDAL